MGEELNDSLSPPPPANHGGHQPRVMPVREDCWSEDATFTLIEAWGQRYLDLNRGNLRQKHWQEVADVVNNRHAHLNRKAYRTDVQSKNRIDTLKKKYKTEKARVLDSSGSYQSQWPFFAPLDALIGSTLSTLKKPSPSSSMSPSMFSSPPQVVMASVAAQQQALGGPPMGVPLLPYRRSMTPVASVLPQKRPFPTPEAAGYSNIRKNYSAVAAAAAAADTDEDEEDEEEEEVKEPEDLKTNGRLGEADGLRKLARAIEMFGEVYARVESEKQRQIVELEKQRMQFAKELECQRMQMLVEMQVQLEKVKRVKRSNSNSNEYC